MAIKDKLTQEFLHSLKEVEPILLEFKFLPFSFYEKGPAYYIKYIQEKTDVIVEFLFGPSDWDVEMIIFTTKGKFAFKDLLQIPIINSWVNENKYLMGREKSVRADVLWFSELLRFSLPFIG